MKKILLLMAIFFSVLLQAQLNTLSMNLPQGHPRYLTDAGGKETTLKLISNEPWAEEVFGKLKSKTDVYVRLTEAQPEWLLSRLAMYWESHATDVYVKGETFDYAGGEKAPVPTVRYTGTRAVANKCKTLDEVKALPMGNGTVQDAVTDRSGITGEKMELDGYMTVEGASTVVYNHMNRNGLCTIVAFNKAVEEGLAKQIAMQIAAMNPIAVDEDGVSEEIKQKEIDVAIEKTKAEQVQKAVEAALKKAGINPAHVDSEDHMESNMAKGWITAEDVAKAKEIIATVSAEKAAHLPEQMIQNIAKGRLGKFLKEVCLLNQEDIMDGKKTVREVLKEADPELKVVDFKRFTLRAE